MLWVASNFENNNNIAHFVGQKKRNVIALIRTDTRPKAEMTKLMSAEVFRGYEKLINFVKTNIFIFFPRPLGVYLYKGLKIMLSSTKCLGVHQGI